MSFLLFCDNLSNLTSFLFSQHFRGRKRNCYKMSLGPVNKSLRFATTVRPVRRRNIDHVSKTIIDYNLTCSLDDHLSV